MRLPWPDDPPWAAAFVVKLVVLTAVDTFCAVVFFIAQYSRQFLRYRSPKFGVAKATAVEITVIEECAIRKSPTKPVA